jgi:hypothetical protein
MMYPQKWCENTWCVDCAPIQQPQLLKANTLTRTGNMSAEAVVVDSPSRHTRRFRILTIQWPATPRRRIRAGMGPIGSLSILVVAVYEIFYKKTNNHNMA